MIGNRVRATIVSFGAVVEIPVGIRVAIGGSDHIIANLVESDSGIGILLSGSQGSVVPGNVVQGNSVALLANPSSGGAIITLNSFDDNRTQARDEGTGNTWDDGRLGNYWSDLQGVDTDGDGVFDQPREVPPRSLDHYPLVDHVPITDS